MSVPTQSAEATAAHGTRVAEQGYTVLEDAIEPALISALRDEIGRLERMLGIEAGGNAFEGGRTLRIYNLLAHGDLFAQVPVHPAVLPVVETVLDEGCLINSFNSITVLPGERMQPIHTDDQLIPLPRPHLPVVCNTIWAITEFTEKNGATRLVPGSHRRAEAPEPLRDAGSARRLARLGLESISVPMRAGSVLVYDGGVWHAAGANKHDAPRVAIAMNYCAGWIRQQENHFLGIPREKAAAFPPRLQELLGYGLYNGLIGHVDRKSPSEFLGRPAAEPVIFYRGGGRP